MHSYLSSGDAGDIAASLATCKHLGTGTYYVDDRPITKPILAPYRFNAIKPLVESQDYITSFEAHKGQNITHDFSTFRQGSIQFGDSLLQLHARWVGQKSVSDEPWLTIEPDAAFSGAVVVNRTCRHRNPLTNWTPILKHYEKDLVFLGLTEEKIQMENEFGIKLRHHITSDLLQASRIIKASRVFLGNQSSLLNCQIGMGGKYLAECSLTAMDTCYKRDCQYILDGSVTNFTVEGYPPLNVESQLPDFEVDWSCSPPGSYWTYRTKDGMEFKNLDAKKLMKQVNIYEDSCNFPISTMLHLANQLFEKHPTYGSTSYANSVRGLVSRAQGIIDRVNAGEVI